MLIISPKKEINYVRQTTLDSAVLLPREELERQIHSTVKGLSKLQSSQLLNEIQSSLKPGEFLQLTNDKGSFFSKLYVTESGLYERDKYARYDEENPELKKYTGKEAARDLVFNGGGIVALTAALNEGRNQQIGALKSSETARASIDKPSSCPETQPGLTNINELSLPGKTNFSLIETSLGKDFGYGSVALHLHVGRDTLRTLDLPNDQNDVFNDKAYQRAIGDSIGVINQPRWISPRVGNQIFDTVEVPVLAILNQINQEELIQKMKAHNARQVNIGPLTITQDKENLTFYAIYKGGDFGLNKHLKIEDFAAIHPESVVLLSKGNEPPTSEDFPSKALELSSSVYFKPRHSCQGDGVFRIDKLDDGRYKITTESVRAGKAIIEAVDELGLDSISKFRRLAFHVKGFLSDVIANSSAPITNKMYHQRSHLELTTDSKEECLSILKKMNLALYLAEETIPLAKLDDKMVEFRFVFESAKYGLQCRLAGHYAKVSGASVTGNLAGGGKGQETLKTIEKLLTRYGGDTSKARETYLSFVSAAERYIEEVHRKLEDINRPRIAADGSVDRSNYGKGISSKILAVDIVPVWCPQTKKIMPYVMETAATGNSRYRIIGLSGLKEANPELYRHAESINEGF